MINVNVTHYLNTKLKPSKGFNEYANELAFPVYIRISYGRKNQRIKSIWINSDVTEKQLITDKRIQGIMKYEREIIYDIFNNTNNDDFNISCELRLYLMNIEYHYQEWVIDLKNLKRIIINFISSKCHLSYKLIGCLLDSMKIEECLDFNSWYELLESGVFQNEIKYKIQYLALLGEFKSIYYKESLPDFHEGCMFNYQEWKNRGAKERFLIFAKKKSIIDINILMTLTDEFDIALRENIKALGEMKCFD